MNADKQMFNSLGYIILFILAYMFLITEYSKIKKEIKEKEKNISINYKPGPSHW